MSPEEQIAAITRAAFDEAGAILVNQIRQEISRTFPPSSDPSTPPHLRTGDLALGISSRVDEFFDGITLSLVSEQFYSIFLRDGTSKMPARDFMGEEATLRYTPIVVEILRKHFGSRGPTPIIATQAQLGVLFGIEWDTAA